jgi:RNA polymerase sigma factor (TIGR02999 family)
VAVEVSVESGPSQEITALLAEWSSGNQEAFDELTPLVYQELRQLAARELRRERPGHTLQSTALVHEAYLRLIGQRRVQWQNREHFFAIAAQIIRRILVSYARGRNSFKRGGASIRVPLEESLAAAVGRNLDLQELDEALSRLSEIDPQQGRIIELRFFGGLSIQQTARVLGISTSTVTRDWNLARAWLHRALTRSAAHAT